MALGLPHVHKWRKQGGFGAATCMYISGGSRAALGWRDQVYRKFSSKEEESTRLYGQNLKSF